MGTIICSLLSDECLQRARPPKTRAIDQFYMTYAKQLEFKLVLFFVTMDFTRFTKHLTPKSYIPKYLSSGITLI